MGKENKEQSNVTSLPAIATSVDVPLRGLERYVLLRRLREVKPSASEVRINARIMDAIIGDWEDRPEIQRSELVSTEPFPLSRALIEDISNFIDGQLKEKTEEKRWNGDDAIVMYKMQQKLQKIVDVE